MYYLGIDSSTKKLSIGISWGDKILARNVYSSSSGYMANIISFIDKILKKVNIPLSAIDNFCVNTGPGDFTGTRIGISIIKTFGFVENKPVHGIDSLDVLALQIFINNLKTIAFEMLKGKNVFIVPLLDVKKEELFFTFYEAKFGNGPDSQTKAMHLLKKEVIYLNKISVNYLKCCENFPYFFGDLAGNVNQTITSRDNLTIFISGTAFVSYRQLFSDLLKSGYHLLLDKKSMNPDVRFLNLSAYFRVLFGRMTGKDQVVVPFYVREFKPFGGKEFKK